MQPPAQQPDRKKSKLPFLIGGLLVLLVAALLLADYYFRTQLEVRQLQGTWKVVRAEINGQPADISLFRKPFQVRGDRIVTGAAGSPEKGFRFRVDPNQNPKTIDFLIRDDDEEAALGIYELDGDTLKLCMRWGPGKERPTEFRVKSMLDGYMAYLEREKP
jgi:uncharacterized protein (TIGR03067 family)